ncbi:unnamed protein product [Rotaria sordida]|uniref:Peptidase S1 domain-containing protein n=1 Tax=Rotaria sordida TaxID=392033 RepID=A0A818PYN8_9BILA|nr:unnamed protein product [Rotaria sordida]
MNNKSDDKTTYICDRKFSCGCSSDLTIRGRIFGGENVLSYSWGWIVSLYRSNIFFCSGSLISSNLILTAAHCIQPELLKLSQITIIAGSNTLSNRDGQGQLRHIYEVFIHPDFENKLKLNDIAIIRLSKPFDMSNSRLAIVCLPNAITAELITKLEYPIPGTTLVVIGWGITEYSRMYPSTILQQVTVKAVASTSSDCTTSTREMVNVTVHFCAGVPGGGKDACLGDSGGPIMAFVDNRWQIVGLISNGYGCALPGHSGIYTRVAYYIPFIETIKNQNQTIYSSVIAKHIGQSISPQYNYNGNTENGSSDVVVDENNLDENQRLVVINESQPLCSVLYLGAAIPLLDKHGIDSIQEPLSKRYPVDGKEFIQGIEIWLSIDENGLQIQYASDPSLMIYYPIRSLVYCASVRRIIRTTIGEEFQNGLRFVPLDYPEVNYTDNSRNPPLFAVIFQRTRHLPVYECHCFVVKSTQDALDLVQACNDAYAATDLQQDCSKVPLYFKINDDGSNIQETDDEIYIVPALNEEKTIDYQVNNKCAGFFYTTNKISINSWQLWHLPKHDSYRPSSRLSSGSLSSISYREVRQRRRTSIQSNSDTQVSLFEFQSKPTNNSTKESLEPSAIDPYAPDPNVVRVERIKDINTGRDVFVRFLRSIPEDFEQPSPNQKPSYDFHIDFNNEYQSVGELSNEMKHLVIDDERSEKSVTTDDSDFKQPTTIDDEHLTNTITIDDEHSEILTTIDDENFTKSDVSDHEHSEDSTIIDDGHFTKSIINDYEHSKQPITIDDEHLKKSDVRDYGHSEKPVIIDDQHFKKSDISDNGHPKKPATIDHQHLKKSSKDDYGHFEKSITIDYGQFERSTKRDYGHFKNLNPINNGRFEKSGFSNYEHSEKPATIDYGYFEKSAPSDYGYFKKLGKNDSRHFEKSATIDYGHLKRSDKRDYRHSEKPITIDYEHFKRPHKSDYRHSEQSATIDYGHSKRSNKSDYQHSKRSSKSDYQHSKRSNKSDYQHSEKPITIDYEYSKKLGKNDYGHSKRSDKSDYRHFKKPTTIDYGRSKKPAIIAGEYIEKLGISDYGHYEKTLSIDYGHLRKPSKSNHRHVEKSGAIDNMPQFITTDHQRKKSKKRHKKHRHHSYEGTHEVFEDHHKKKHSHKTHKGHRHKHHEVMNLSAPALLQQQFPTQSFSTGYSYESRSRYDTSFVFPTLPLPYQSNVIDETSPYRLF